MYMQKSTKLFWIVVAIVVLALVARIVQLNMQDGSSANMISPVHTNVLDANLDSEADTPIYLIGDPEPEMLKTNSLKNFEEDTAN